MARGLDRSRAWPGRTTPRRAPLKDLIGLEDLSFCEPGNGELQISAGDLLSAGAFAVPTSPAGDKALGVSWPLLCANTALSSTITRRQAATKCLPAIVP